jgi:hypothetical protein
MTMKKSDAPRRTYTREGMVLVCFQGRFFGCEMNATEIDVTREVVLSEAGTSENPQVTVTQKRRGKKTLVETWDMVIVNRASRSSQPPTQN